MNVLKTTEFENWYKKKSLREQAQIDARIAKIEKFDHFGDAKCLGDGSAD